MQKFDGLAELVAAEGAELGPTEWLEITQERVDLFADATEDHQWIHVDPERAANGPFGGTIAQSVVEEKQTRVVELLISAIPVRSLLAGKVIGNTILAMGEILILVAIAVVGLTVTGQSELLQGLGAPIAWFAVFFFFGFVLLATLFAAAAPQEHPVHPLHRSPRLGT